MNVNDYYRLLFTKAKDLKNSAVDQAQKESSALSKWSAEQFEDYQDRQKPLVDDNWFERTAAACEKLSDAIICEKGWTNRMVSVASGKLAAAAIPTSLFSVAALVGTASTGTAIGSLSGAAFTSSALAWIGGSVAMGTMIVSGAAIAGAIAVPFAVKPLSSKYLLGKTRRLEDLSGPEKQLVDACSALALGLRQAEKGNRPLSAREADTLNEQALKPMAEKASEVLWISRTWPAVQRRAFRSAFIELSFSHGFAKQASNLVHPVSIGIGTALIFNLLSDGEHRFTDAEQDILDAMRRSSSALSEMSNEEIAASVQSLSPTQLQGFKNNVKGIAHELQFARIENSNGDEFQVELFEATNHAGSDVQIINVKTGEIREFQLKATSYGAYVETHIERYEDTPVIVTEEVAEELGYQSSGISNEQLSGDFNKVTEILGEDADPSVLESMTVAGIVSLALNVRLLLDDKSMTDGKRTQAVKQSMQAGLVAGIAELLT